MKDERPLRDRLGEALRRARIGTVEAWDHLTEDCREDWRRSADHLLRILPDMGLSFSDAGSPVLIPPPASPEIWTGLIEGQNAERLLRKGKGEQWEIIRREPKGDVKRQISFTIHDALMLGDRVLRGDASVKGVAGAMTILAAANEVYRLDALAVEA